MAGVRRGRKAQRGYYINEDGYVRLSAGPYAGKYQHRLVVEQLLGRPIPPRFEVGHNDFIRHHNCPENLILMQDVLNHAPGWRPASRKRDRQGRYTRKAFIDA